MFVKKKKKERISAQRCQHQDESHQNGNIKLLRHTFFFLFFSDNANYDI